MHAMDPPFDLKPSRNGGVKHRRSDSLESLEGWPSPKKLVTEQLKDDAQRWQATGYKQRGFTAVNPPKFYRSAHFQTILNRDSDGNKHPALDLHHKNLTDACTTADGDQAAQGDVSDYHDETSGSSDNEGIDEDPRPDEHLISYCHRVGYVTVDTHLPSESASMQAFLNLAPVRSLERNLLSTARPWRPNTTGYANWHALLTQLSGRVTDEPCTKCARGLARWAHCIVPPTPETMLAVNGACGCCLYNNQGSTCSFARAEQERLKIIQDEREQVMGDIMMNAASMAELAAQQCRLLLKFQTLDKARRR
ncbi:hypothetical protein GE09DRAFT_1196247 [Coniochaeta sp. 2T2.1]|nr:hypothetical protein GE09DRAFT_1196247 [Coniochaeta sp. 2T2.1]